MRRRAWGTNARQVAAACVHSCVGAQIVQMTTSQRADQAKEVRRALGLNRQKHGWANELSAWFRQVQM